MRRPTAAEVGQPPWSAVSSAYVTVFDKDTTLPPETAFRSMREGDLESFYWVEDGKGYALTAPLSAAEAMALAREVYRQLSS